MYTQEISRQSFFFLHIRGGKVLAKPIHIDIESECYATVASGLLDIWDPDTTIA